MFKKLPLIFWLLLVGAIIILPSMVYIVGGDVSPIGHAWWHGDMVLTYVSIAVTFVGSIIWVVVFFAWLVYRLPSSGRD